MTRVQIGGTLLITESYQKCRTVCVTGESSSGFSQANKNSTNGLTPKKSRFVRILRSHGLSEKRAVIDQ